MAKFRLKATSCFFAGKLRRKNDKELFDSNEEYKKHKETLAALEKDGHMEIVTDETLKKEKAAEKGNVPTPKKIADEKENDLKREIEIAIRPGIVERATRKGNGFN